MIQRQLLLKQQNTHYQIVKMFIGYLGGLPKKNDKIILLGIKKNIIKCYLIGKNINFFKSKLKIK